MTRPCLAHRPAARRGALRAAAFVAALALPTAAWAHEGHGSEPVAGPRAETGAAAGTAGPRFAAASDQFELVGALDGRRLTLWLDRFADNTPLAGARIELEVGADRLVAQPAGDVYVAELPALPAPSTLPVTASVEAGGLGDLLAAELVVPAAASGGPAAAPAAGPRAPTGRGGLAVGAALAAAGVAGALAWRAARRRT